MAPGLANGVLALAEGVPQLDGLVAGAGHDLLGCPEQQGQTPSGEFGNDALRDALGDA